MPLALDLLLIGIASLPLCYYSLYIRPRTVKKRPARQPGDPIMQAPRTDLAPPKDDPYTLEDLKQYDGKDSSKPIFVSIKGTVFDVTHKADVYGPGKGYNVFAGKDASKGLGMSSLKPEDAIPDYSGLAEKDLKVLNEWFDFFSKRYNIVGKVTNLPSAVANL